MLTASKATILPLTPALPPKWLQCQVTLRGAGVGVFDMPNNFLIQYFIDIDILQNSLIDIDIDIFKKVHIDINIFKNDHVDIDIDIF